MVIIKQYQNTFPQFCLKAYCFYAILTLQGEPTLQLLEALPWNPNYVYVIQSLQQAAESWLEGEKMVPEEENYLSSCLLKIGKNLLAPCNCKKRNLMLRSCQSPAQRYGKQQNPYQFHPLLVTVLARTVASITSIKCRSLDLQIWILFVSLCRQSKSYNALWIKKKIHLLTVKTGFPAAKFSSRESILKTKQNTNNDKVMYIFRK